MKMLKKLTTLLLSAAFLCTLVLTPAKVSHAADATTWYLTFNDDAWYASSNKMTYWTSQDYVAANFADGDSLVVNGNSSSSGVFNYKIDKKINELVSTGGAAASIEAPYVEKAYVAGKNSVLIVTAPTVHFVEVYPAQTIQVNGNVIDLQAHYDYSSENPVFAVTGTVTAANVAYGGSIENSTHRIYGIGAGLMKSNATGYVTLSEGQYSLTLTEPPTSGTTQKSTDSAASGKKLDKVPQTGAGVSMETYIFGGLAILFAVAAVMVGFTTKKNS